jgi:hypothetical protein
MEVRTRKFTGSTLGLMVVLLLVAWRRKPAALRPASSTQQSSSLIPSTNPVNFDATQFFRVSYQSMQTQEVERRIRIAAEQNEPNNREAFYMKLIGIGLIANQHDMTWAYIYRNQILMLADLNRRGGIMPLNDARAYYEQDKENDTQLYANNYSLDQWVGYMVTRTLIVRHPTDMLEIALGGRDFITFIAHHGRTADGRKG